MLLHHPFATASTRDTQDAVDPERRRILIGAGAVLGTLAAPRIVRAQSQMKMRIAYYPTPASLPFYVALEKGYFRDAGLEVELVKVTHTAQAMMYRA